MHRKLCLLHANCQGEELAVLLRASAAFDNRYRLVLRTNYTREPVSKPELAECDVFLYQHLDDSWGEISSKALLGSLGQLAPSALALQIPNLLFTGYWPFWTAHGPIDFSDTLLNRLIDEGAPKPAILKLYLHSDITKFIDLAAALDETIAIERQKETGSCVKYVDYALQLWKKRMMFLTVNHPGPDLLVHVAQGILDALGLPPLAGQELAGLQGNFPSYIDFELPVHPQVAAFHGLEFGGPEQTYAVFTRRMTFEQYVSRYIDCRLSGMDADFLGYLQLM
jgi:hypothetical protein